MITVRVRENAWFGYIARGRDTTDDSECPEWFWDNHCAGGTSRFHRVRGVYF